MILIHRAVLVTLVGLLSGPELTVFTQCSMFLLLTMNTRGAACVLQRWLIPLLVLTRQVARPLLARLTTVPVFVLLMRFRPFGVLEPTAS